MVYLGIDPGFTGAWGLINHHGDYVGCGDMIHNEKWIDINSVYREISLIRENDDMMIVVEAVHDDPDEPFLLSQHPLRLLKGRVHAGHSGAVIHVTGQAVLLIDGTASVHRGLGYRLEEDHGQEEYQGLCHAEVFESYPNDDSVRVSDS